MATTAPPDSVTAALDSDGPIIRFSSPQWYLSPVKKAFVMSDYPVGGCGMPQIGVVTGKPLQPVKMLPEKTPFYVLETADTSVGAMAEHHVYGRITDPVEGWVNLTVSQCEKCEGPASRIPTDS